MKFLNSDPKQNKNEPPEDEIPDRSVEKQSYIPSYREVIKNRIKKEK